MLLASAAVGLWLLFSTLVLGVDGTPGHAANLLGALAASVALIALAEVARVVRYLNLPVGLAIVTAGPLFGGPPAHVASMVIAGGAIMILSIPRGEIRERYGAWNRWVR